MGWTSHDDHPFPGPIVFSQTMTFVDSTFGGPCFLKNNKWSCQHRIETDDKIQDKTGDDLKLLYSSEDRDKLTQVLKSNAPSCPFADLHCW